MNGDCRLAEYRRAAMEGRIIACPVPVALQCETMYCAHRPARGWPGDKVDLSRHSGSLAEKNEKELD